MTVGSPPSRTATTELVVPRSIPTARDIWESFPTKFVGVAKAFCQLLELPTLKVPQVGLACQINLSQADSTLRLSSTAPHERILFRRRRRPDVISATRTRGVLAKIGRASCRDGVGGTGGGEYGGSVR